MVDVNLDFWHLGLWAPPGPGERLKRPGLIGLILILFIHFRGTADGDSNHVPFRKWYGNLMELTSLLSSPRLAVFTATASKSTKRKIFEALKLNHLTTCVIEKYPNKDNLRYVVKYIENDLSLNDIFHTLISELRSKSTETEGTLVFCRTRKQCSLIFRAITAAIGNSVYYGRASPKNRIVEMFHAGTPDSVKNHIITTVTSNWGHIRVLICTISFGMGIDCQYISHIIHFGGSKCIESYLQECGRAGRKGQLSTYILYYNGMLMRYSADDMKNYTSSKICRRKEISSVVAVVTFVPLTVIVERQTVCERWGCWPKHLMRPSQQKHVKWVKRLDSY